MPSSPDPVATLRDAWRHARQSLSFSSVRGWHETSTHHLHFGGYSTVSNMYKHGEGVESKRFCAGGYWWSITYYPNGNGYLASKTGSPGVDLRLNRMAGGGWTDATAGLTVSILDRDGNLLCSRCVQPRHYSSWSSTDIRIDVSEETKAALRHLKDDSLVVRCDVTMHRSAKESTLRWLLGRFLD